MPADQIQYSEKYFDSNYEYRHVILPPDLTKHVPKSHLMTETEWRNLGIQQSPGWVHYMMHAPEPHVILFRRPLTRSNNGTIEEQPASVLQLQQQEQQQQQQQEQQHQQQQQSGANNNLPLKACLL